MGTVQPRGRAATRGRNETVDGSSVSGWSQHQRRAHWDDARTDVFGAAWRRMALALSAVLILGCVGLLFSPAKPAGAATPGPFTSGQVFASVGGGTVNVYDPVSGALLGSTTDNSGTTYNAGSTFDANGNLYVTDDDAGHISEFNSSGAQIGQFTGLADASGDSNDPLSLTFDNRGNLTSASSRRRTSPSSIRAGSASPTSARSRPSSTATTGSTLRPTSAPSTTRPKATRSSPSTTRATPRDRCPSIRCRSRRRRQCW